MADYIHKPPPTTIYVRTDYLVNSNREIGLGLARQLLDGYATEAPRRTGFAEVDRSPHHSLQTYAGPGGRMRPNG